MSMERFTHEIACTRCGPVSFIEVENDGWTYMRRGPERHYRSLPEHFTQCGTGVQCTLCRRTVTDPVSIQEDQTP